MLAGPFAEAIRGSLDERLRVVSDLLLAPLMTLIGERRVVLTPSAQLAGTPWTLLPRLAGRPVTVPPSATRWLELRRTTRRQRPRVGLVAGPALERAEEEVMRAAAAWPRATMLVGDQAVAAKVAAMAAKVDLLHLAGHGRHPGDNPLFSAVELADGPWFGYDIDQLPHTPGLVVLSSCELGRASVRSGDEVVGMTAAWLHAGASASPPHPPWSPTTWRARCWPAGMPGSPRATPPPTRWPTPRATSTTTLLPRRSSASAPVGRPPEKLRLARINPHGPCSYVVKGDPVGCIGIGGFECIAAPGADQRTHSVGPLRGAPWLAELARRGEV